MEAVGLAASIIAIIDVTAKTIQYLNDVRTSSSERAKLAIEAADVFARLASLRYRLEACKDANDPWFQAVQGLNAPLESFKVVMEELASKLTEKRGVRKIVSALSWPLDKKAALEYLTKIERVKGLVMLALQEDLITLSLAIKADTDALPHINTSLANLSQGVKAIQSEGELRKVQQITDWLSPLNFYTTQDDVLDKRQPGTGQWFLNSKVFESWVSSEGASLWCPGIPGAGKTILTSIVIDWLRQSFRNDPDVRVAGAYCSYRDRGGQTVFSVLTGLWRQLLQPNAKHAEDVGELYENHFKYKTLPTVANFMKVMEEEIKRHSRVFIVVDALDEFSESYRSELMRRLRSLQPNANLLVTSRKLESIAEELAGVPQIAINAKNEDIITYIEARITREAKLSRLMQKSPDLESDVKTAIIEKSQAMFLLTRLFMDSLAAQPTVRKFRSALARLPTKLDETYEDALQRIEATDRSGLAIKILYWISSALRPLQLDELLHALAVEPGDSDFDEENLLLEDITSVCAGLVEIDQNSKVVRLAHYTTQDFLKRIRNERFPNSSNEIALACLTYLSFDKLTAPLPQNVTLRNIESRYRLFNYAARSWGYHLTEPPDPDPDTQALAVTFLNKDYRLSDFIIEDVMAENNVFHGNNVTKTGTLSGLHIAVMFNLVEITKQLATPETQAAAEAKYLVSPLEYACRANRPDIAKVFLETGADINKTGRFPWRPLHHAATSGNPELTRLLIDSGANLDDRIEWAEGQDHYSNVMGQTPLHEACWNDQPEVCQVLIDRGADLELPLTGGDRDNAIVWAARNSHRCLRLLVRRGASLTHRRLMFHLIQTCSVEVLQEAINHGIDLNQPCEGEKSALDFAFELRNTDVIGLLLKNGAQPRLPWNRQAPEVQRYSTQPWFADLEVLLLAREATDPELGGDLCGLRQDHLVLNQQACGNPYLEVPITGEIVQPVRKVVFRTISHDQGWSDYPHNHSSYRESFTWFEADILIRSRPNNENESRGRRTIQHNVHASTEWRTHVNVWDRNAAGCSEDLRRWMDGLTEGNTLQVYARAIYQGWENHVQLVQVDVYGTKSTSAAPAAS